MWIIDFPNGRKENFAKCSNCEYHDEDYICMEDKYGDTWDEFQVWCNLNDDSEDVNVCEHWKPQTWDKTNELYYNFYRLTNWKEYPQENDIKTYISYTKKELENIFEEKRKRHAELLSKYKK